MNHPAIRFNNIPVMKVDEHKHLGIILDSKLSFSAHIKAAVSKARKGVGLLKYLSKYLPRNSLNELFKLYVRPHLEYGDVIFHIPAKVCEFSGNTILPSLMEKLESVQHPAALAVTGTWRGTSREKLYAELGWESLSSRRWSRRLILFYKMLSNPLPEYTVDPIPQLQQPHYSLRNQDVIGPPSATIETFENLERVLRFLESEDKEIILLGDTNCDFSNKTSESSSNNLPNNINRLADLYNSFGLTQLISEPTRETIDTSTIIDHIAVNVECNIIESGVLKLALSDHHLVYAIRKFRGNIPCNHKMIKTRQMKNFNDELFLKDLVNVDWQQILTCSQDINVVVQNWTNMLSLMIEKHAPLRERRVPDKFAPWLTPDLMNMFRTRDRLKAAAIKSKSVLLMEAYKKIRNKANALNTRLKKSYFTDKIHSCEGNIKETWTTINKLINKRSKTTNITSLRVDDETITKPDLIAESMNKYFCSVGEQLSKKIPKKMNSFISSQILAPESNFSFSPVNAEDLTKAMSKFKSSQGFGMDNISSFFLKKSMPILANGLCQIFNMSLSTGKFPDSWKAGRVAPIYKDGSSSENSNYRPISVLPVVSRLFEKLMYDQLYTYLSNNHLLFTGQSGFSTVSFSIN